MKNALKIFCLILALCLLCSCSKAALDSISGETPNDTENTPPPSVSTEDDASSGDEEVQSPDCGGDTPPEVVAFRTYTSYEDIFSVINGNADITYGVYPDEAQQSDGSATVVSANGLTEQKNVLSPTATDGTYIYTVNRGTLFVCDENGIIADAFLFTDDFSRENGSSFSYGYENAEGVFFTETYLAVVSSMYEYDSSGKETYKVNIYFCDISDSEAPKVHRTLSQDGRFISASVSEGYLYAVSSHMITSASEGDITTYVPHIYSTEKTPVSPENIHVFEYSTGAGYTVIASYDTASASLSGSAAVLGGTGRFYMDETDIYTVFFTETSKMTNTYTEDKYEVEEFENRCMTAVLKFPMDAQPSPSGEALADGCFMGDFSVYSKDGTLYLCTIAECSTYAIYTDTESGWSERRDVSAEVENILYAMSDDLTNTVAHTLPDDVVFSARFADDYVWVGYFSEELCFDLNGSEQNLPAIPSCCVTYNEDQLLGISRTDADTLTFTMYNAKDLSVVSDTVLPVPTSFLNSTSVAVHRDSGLITLSAGAAGHCVVSFDGENFELETSVLTSGWVHCTEAGSALYIISDKVTVLDISDFSEISVFELTAQSGAVG